MLQEIIEEQLKLNKKIVDNFGDIIYTDNINLKRKWLNNMITAMQCECSELMESSGWKWWKKLSDWDEDTLHNLKVETVDILHFLISSMIILGMDAQEIYDLYMKKNKLNEDRQNKGYKTGEYEKVDEHGKEDNYYLKDK